MTAVTSLLNRESARDTILENIKDAERLVAHVATKQGKVMQDLGYATYIAVRSGLSKTRTGEILNKAPSTVTLYFRLGRYLVLGGDPNSQQWSVLSSKARASNKDVGAAIEADDATIENIHKVLAEQFLPDGKPHPKPESAQTGADPTGTGDGDVPPMTEATALIERLAVVVTAMDAEAFSSVETMLHALITRQVENLRQASEVVPKAAPKGKAKAKVSA